MKRQDIADRRRLYATHGASLTENAIRRAEGVDPDDDFVFVPVVKFDLDISTTEDFEGPTQLHQDIVALEWYGTPWCRLPDR